MYLFKNSDLKEDFPFLIQQADTLHPNDPNRAALIRIAKDLLFLDKQETLNFIKTIQDDDLMFYAISAHCWVRFPSKAFVLALKKEMDRFRNKGGYDILMLHYAEALKYLGDLEADKINTRAYQTELKKKKQSSV
jgi:hypothetical protein